MITPAGKLALEMLVGDQTILNLAREVTAAIEASGAEGGVIGGIAVFLHGYERTTTDIDVYTTDRAALAEQLTQRGFVWSDERRQFEKNDIPVQLLAPEDKLPYYPKRFRSLHDIQTLTLGELVTMKLSTGTEFVHRAQDLADVIRLIEAIPLDKSFVTQIDTAYRSAFKKLIDDLVQERG
ncbi:MAG: hypothetical protein AAF911_13525 [Planctomycetota bacterium]